MSQRLSRNEIETLVEDSMSTAVLEQLEVPLPQNRQSGAWVAHRREEASAEEQNKQLGVLRAVAKSLGGRPLTDAERDAVLYERCPQEMMFGIPVNVNEYKRRAAEHAELRNKLLALL